MSQTTSERSRFVDPEGPAGHLLDKLPCLNCLVLTGFCVATHKYLSLTEFLRKSTDTVSICSVCGALRESDGNYFIVLPAERPAVNSHLEAAP